MDLNFFKIDDKNVIRWKLTPWDTKAFGIKTLEIINFNCTDFSKGCLLLDILEKFVLNNGVAFVYCRISAENRDAKLVLHKRGFYLAELSLELEKKNLLAYNMKFPLLKLLNINKKDIRVINEIKDIAMNSFDFGRFHDDIQVDIDKARNRYCNWIDDLLIQDVEAYYIEHQDEVIGIHFQRIENQNAELILTGCKKGYSAYAVPLWHSVFQSLKEIGISNCKTMISASNAGIINLYTLFQFKTTRSLLGFHKFYKH